MTAEPLSFLLVEDEPDDVLFFRRALREIDPAVRVEVATDGVEAMDHLGDGRPRPDLVVLDLKLPRRSGLEVLAWLRAREALRDLRVVILSSSGEPSDIRRARELGIDDYLVKPTAYQDLRAAVQGLVAVARRR
jgi:CheY-like chemotaxis protein